MMRSMGFVRVLALGCLFVAAVLAKPVAADETLKVELWDRQDGSQGIILSAAEVKAGNVTFEVTNSSKGMEHEFLYVKTDMAADQLPMQEAGIKVDEGKLTGFHEFGDVEPGETKSWSADLEPGRYLLFCNEEGHFMAGMHTTLTVTP